MSGIMLVTLPIGNNLDLTERARITLVESQVIFAEDTRVFRDFCRHNEIDLAGKYINSFHDHTEELKTNQITQLMSEKRVTLVSDAGSPIVSDPSFPLVLKAKELGLSIQTSPGVSAVITALELSALSPSPFHFHSFIGRDKGKKASFFEECSFIYGTHIFFEGVSRVEKTVDQLVESFPDEDFCIARELTKTHESVYRFNAESWSEVKKNIIFKGEFVVLFSNRKKLSITDSKVRDLALEIIEKGAAPKKISKLLAAITDQNAKEIYQKILKK